MKRVKIALVPTVLFLLALLGKANREIAAYEKYVGELHTYTAAIEQRIPTFAEIQQKLAAAGYEPGPIDGKIGLRTLAAWDRAICDQYAEAWDFLYEDGNGRNSGRYD